MRHDVTLFPIGILIAYEAVPSSNLIPCMCIENGYIQTVGCVDPDLAFLLTLLVLFGMIDSISSFFLKLRQKRKTELESLEIWTHQKKVVDHTNGILQPNVHESMFQNNLQYPIFCLMTLGCSPFALTFDCVFGFVAKRAGTLKLKLDFSGVGEMLRKDQVQASS